MTKEQFAAMLNGREYRDEITDAECELAKSLGFLVVFGASDDLCEFRGAFEDEADFYDGDGGEVTIDSQGILLNWDSFIRQLPSKDEVVKWMSREQNAKNIEILWDEVGCEFTWEYKTDIPHATFEIFDDNEPYCRGMVIDTKDMK